MTVLKFVPAILVLGVAALASDETSNGLRFEPNVGQTNQTVSFLSRWAGSAVFLTASGATIRTRNSDFRVELVASNPGAHATGLEPLPSQTNYLIGTPDSWHTGLPSYSRVEYQNVYPGVDVVYYGGADGLHYDFSIHPGADSSRIMLRLEGVEPIQFAGDGSLVARTPAGERRDTNAEVYQVINGARSKVPARFLAAGPNEVRLVVDSDDTLEPMVMTYSTYLGGSGQDCATSIAVDSAGNSYVAGWTVSTDFPEAIGTRLGTLNSDDVYVAKLSPAGQLLYVTYLGGSGQDEASGIAVDSSGSAVVVGFTYSTNFPTVNAVQASPGGGEDGFVAKLSATGNGLVFSTYLGGSGADSANAVALDGQGAVYVAGETTSANFRVLNPWQSQIGGGDDAFVAKFTSAGATVYSTFLGGRENDRATAIAVDSYGYAYITGSTYSTNFPTANPFQSAIGGGQDAFAAKIGLAGNSLIYSTYIGGSGGTVGAPETGNGIAVDSAGSAYIAGDTSSQNFPTSNPFQSALDGSEDAFILKLNASGNALVYSTYLGGSSVDFGNAIAVDAAGDAYIAGYTGSTDFPIANAVQSANAGGYDAFIVELNPAGNTLELGTYLGGTASDAAYGIALDASDNIYIAGLTQSTNFPTVAAVQLYPLSAVSGFVARVAYAVSFVNPQLTSPTAGTVLSTSSVTFTWNAVTGAQNYWIDVGTSARSGNISSGYTGGATSVTVNLTPYLTGGTIYVQLYSQFAGVNLVAGTGSLFQFATTAQSSGNPQLTSPTTGTVLSASPVTFAWNAVSGAQDYWIDVGTSARSGNISSGYTGGATSATVNLTGYLTGGTIYVQLYSKFAGVNPVGGTGSLFQFTTTTLPSGNPQLTSPLAGTVLSTSSVTFTWNAVTGAQDYWIDVGTSARTGNISGGYTGGATSVTVNLTGYLTGETIYVQLYSKFAGVNPVGGTGSLFQFATMAPPSGNPQLSAPTTGTVLSAPSVTFTWNAVTGAQDYWIDVGTSARTGNISGEYTGGATSVTVNLTGYLTGGTIYVQLYSKFAGVTVIGGTGSLFQFATLP